MYIDVKMLEGEEFCITACPSGFYLNRSVPDVSFDPTPRKVALGYFITAGTVRAYNYCILVLMYLNTNRMCTFISFVFHNY